MGQNLFSVYENTYSIYTLARVTLLQTYQLITLSTRLSSLSDYKFRGMNLWPYSVRDYRETGQPHIKLRMLPAAIFFATTKVEDRKVFERYSGYFCVDIDYEDNKQVIDSEGLGVIEIANKHWFDQYRFGIYKSIGQRLKNRA